MIHRAAPTVLGLALLLAGCGLAPARPSDPLTAEEHNDLGMAYYTRGEYTLAVRAFSRATALRPGWARALANLGDAHLAVGEVETAIAAYEGAVRASPDDAGIANNLAWALLQHGQRWQEAEPVIRAALARDPEPRGYYLDTLGLLLLRKGSPGEALDAFRAALSDTGIRDRTTRALVLRHAGEALVSLGDVIAAERCHALALRLAGAEMVRPGSGARPEAASGLAVGDTNTVC